MGSGRSKDGAVRVAVTGVNGDAGQGTIHGLRAGAPQRSVWILGMDYYADGAGFHMVDRPLRSPGVVSEGYRDFLASALTDNGIELLFPGVDAEIEVLAPLRDGLERETGCRVLVEDEELVRNASDKLLTSAWLEGLGLAAPRTVDAAVGAEAALAAVGLPAIAKPRHGHGSVGLFALRDRGAFDAFFASEHEGYCVQELVEGPEYTCGLLFDGSGTHGDRIAMRRELRDGRTVQAEVHTTPEIDAYLAAFGRGVDARGAINLQLRLDGDGRPLVFEVNPRLSGSTGMRVAVGFNDPLRLLEHALHGTPIEPAVVEPARVYRYSSELVVRP